MLKALQPRPSLPVASFEPFGLTTIPLKELIRHDEMSLFNIPVLYQEGKLINLGTNRWTFRPQVGLVHNRNRWTYELTASAWLFSNNDEYFQGTKLEQDPLYSLQGHLIHTFRPGLWASISMGYGAGARATINGMRADTDQGNFLWVASFGFPIDRQQGIKLAFLRGSTSRATGVNYDSLIVSYAYMWGEGL